MSKISALRKRGAFKKEDTHLVYSEENIGRTVDLALRRYAYGRRMYEDRKALSGPVRVIVKDGKPVV